MNDSDCTIRNIYTTYRLVGSVSIEGVIAHLTTPQWTHYLSTGFDNLTAATAKYQHVAKTLTSRQLLMMGT